MKFVPTPADFAKARKHKLKARGIVYPTTAVWAARVTGTPLAYACATLQIETNGGINEFGHDGGTIFAGAGKVTKAKYKAYKARRGTTHMQGVGPCQLTWWSTQDAADALGGCWKPCWNMVVAFRMVMSNIRSKGVHAGIKAYNGSGDAAERYASLWQEFEKQWDSRFKNDVKKK